MGFPNLQLVGVYVVVCARVRVRAHVVFLFV